MSHRNRYRAERRQRLVGGLVKLSLFCGLLGTTAFYAYHVGVHVAQDEMAEMSAKLQQEAHDDSQAAAELARLQTALAAARREAEQFRGLYQRNQPSAEAAELMRLVQEKLGAGLPRDRLAFFIQAAETPAKCGEVVAKKLAVRVGSKGGEEVRFGEAGAALAVTAEGAPAEAGKAFDPAKPVTLRFAPAGGKPSQVTGTLPLTHTVLTRNYEQRFTITAGGKGVLQLSGDRCEFRAG